LGAGGIASGLLTLALAPYIIYRLHPPEVRDTQAARVHAAGELAQMGPMSRRESTLSLIFLGVMAGWITSPWHGINNTIVALAGISAILLCRVVTWDDLLAEAAPGTALIWFGPVVMNVRRADGIRRHPHPLQRALSRDARLVLARGGGGAGGGLTCTSTMLSPA